jgi:hypothetical protein
MKPRSEATPVTIVKTSIAVLSIFLANAEVRHGAKDADLD